MTTVDVLIVRLDKELPMPSRSHPGDAGIDLFSTRDVELLPGARAAVGTGIAVALPAGWAAFVHPRSGLALRHGLTMVNSPGTIDAGYRGEITVLLWNTDPGRSVNVHRGERIAQLVVQRVPEVVLHEVERLPGSHRGSAGFGSTGVHGPGATG